MYLESLVKLAADEGTIVTALPAEVEWFGVHVRDMPGGEVWAVRMMFNWRVLETPDEWSIGRSWCYLGIGPETFLLAVRHAALYGDGEPDGWIKAWDGRRGDLPTW